MTLTKRQAEILTEMCRRYDVNGYWPTLREMAVHFNVAMSSINQTWKILILKKYLKKLGKNLRRATVATKLGWSWYHERNMGVL